MRDTGGEGLKRRNCWDLLLATVEDGLPVPPLWAFTSISMRCPNILPRCRPDLRAEGCQSLNLRCPHPDSSLSSCNGCHFEMCLWGNSRNALKASNTLTSSQICLAPRLLQKYPPKITKVSYQTPKTDKRLGVEVGGEDWGVTDGGKRETSWDPTVTWQTPVLPELQHHCFWRRRSRRPAARLTCEPDILLSRPPSK